MIPGLPSTHPLRQLSRDGRLLFATRSLRLFAYGFLSVVLALYLAAAGLDEKRIGLLLTLTLLGDAAISLWLTTSADRLGRRKMLVVGAGLMVVGGVVFASTGNFWLLLVAATIGVISPSGNEVGPFLSIEQAALSQVISGDDRTTVFAWYNLSGQLATALGALAGGSCVAVLRGAGMTEIGADRVVMLGYAAAGVLLVGMFTRVSAEVEVSGVTDAEHIEGARAILGLHRSRGIVAKLAGLFAMDSFGGGFVVQSLLAYWFHVKFGVQPATLGAIFFGANLLAAISSLAAARLAAKIGLINTMVFTHLPSNVLLMLVPVMPNVEWAIVVLLLRFSISQMDVPTRQSYTMAVVDADERSAAAGVTGVARSLGAAISPSLAGALMSSAALMSVPFFAAGGIKIIYDLLLYRSFIKLRPAE